MTKEIYRCNLFLTAQTGTMSERKNNHNLIDSWSLLAVRLPKKYTDKEHPEYNPHIKKFIRSYFEIQAEYKRNPDDPVRARRAMRGLEKRTGFLEFERTHQSLLAGIEIAVRGFTNRKIDEDGILIEPEFIIS